MKHLVKNKHWRITEDYNIDKILYLLIDRPDSIDLYNDFSTCYFWVNSKIHWHRNYNLPAVVSRRKTVSWWKNNKRYKIKQNKW